jgi:hypothetical protein
MSTSATYEAYDEHSNARALLPAPKKPYHRCCGCIATLLSYLLVAYISADATLIACLKTNCSSPNHVTIITNNTEIDLQSKQSMTYLIISESVAGMLLVLLMCNRCYKYLC